MSYNFQNVNSNLPVTKSETSEPKPSSAKVKETFSNRQVNSLNNNAIATKKRQEINNALPQRDPDNTRQSPSGKDVKTSQNEILRSRYCQEEMKRPEYNKKSSRSFSQTRRGSSAKSAVECDVTFLRTLLAMNKKEELILNKKLARILGEEEFGSCRQHQKVFGRSLQRSGLAHNPEDDLNSVSSADKESNRKISPLRQYQYDLNGRRVFAFTDDEDDNDSTVNSEYEKQKFSIQPNSLRSKTWINTTTVIKTESNMSCDLNGRNQMSSKRKSLTFINLPDEQNKYQVEDLEDILQPRKSRWREREANFLESPPDCWPKRKADSHGDGIQNVVVHCCEVAQQEICADSKKGVVKVWHFNKKKTGNSVSENGNRLGDISSMVKTDETKAHSTNCQGRSSNQRSRRRRLRSNTIC